MNAVIIFPSDQVSCNTGFTRLFQARLSEEIISLGLYTLQKINALGNTHPCRHNIWNGGILEWSCHISYMTMKMLHHGASLSEQHTVGLSAVAMHACTLVSQATPKHVSLSVSRTGILKAIYAVQYSFRTRICI